MKKLKHLSCVIIVCILSTIIYSCGNDKDDNDVINITFGLTSASSFSSEEQTAINSAYKHAYDRAGLKHSTSSFAPDSQRHIILKACEEADKAILTSSIKFDGSYTYEVFEITSSSKNCIYRRVYGIRY